MNKLFFSLYVLAHSVPDRLKREDRGATAVEYGLLVGLIAVVIIVAVVALGGKLNGMFEGVNTKLSPSSGAAVSSGNAS
jgi:pilus assembly protein Flp/PilA